MQRKSIIAKGPALQFLVIAAFSGIFAVFLGSAVPFPTNTPGTYFLVHPWVGQLKIVVQTGFSALPTVQDAEKREGEIRFDLFTVLGKSSPTLHSSLLLGKSMGQTKEGWSETMVHSYRPTLPENGDIQACSTVPKMLGLLGDPIIEDRAPYAASWAFFTFTSTNTIEVVSVFCMGDLSLGKTNWRDDHISSLEIRRAILKQSDK
jgi:hypothetical protein